VLDVAPALAVVPVPSSPPATATTADGWTLTLSADTETLTPAPLSPNVPARDFVVGGRFNGTLRGPRQTTTPRPSGTIEAGYQIHCLPSGLLAALKPSVTNVKVLKEDYNGADPSVAVTDYRVQVDCLGDAFIRSYAILTRTTNTANSVVAYYGVPTPATANDQ
jgi:hypothetical protein